MIGAEKITQRIHQNAFFPPVLRNTPIQGFAANDIHHDVVTI
jgi:hypothetical protein